MIKPLTAAFERWGTSPWRASLLALLVGPLITLSLAPFSLWPLAIIACTLMMVILDGQRLGTVCLRGWLIGIGLFGSGTSWVYVSIHDHGYAPVPLALFLTLIFCLGLALFHLVTAAIYHLGARRAGALRVLIFPAAWALGEWLRAWVFTGFPWLYIGYGHVDTPLAGWAPVLGVLGPTLAIALSGVALYELVKGNRASRSLSLALAAMVWLAGWGLDKVDWVKPAGEPIEVAMIQPNIAQSVKWAPGAFPRIIEQYQRMSDPLWGTDLLIWPEAAIPRLYNYVPGLVEELDRKARDSGSSFITGVPLRRDHDNGDEDYYNAVIGLGLASGIYHKQHLVPFGEYVPLESLLRGMIDFFDLPMSSFSWGAPNQPPLKVGRWSLAPFVCYEVVYPDLVATDTRVADFILTVSNDSWFGHSIGPKQHFEIARMRALENGRYMIRATNNGISGIIDHRGQLEVSAPQFTEAVISGRATPMAGLTPFGRWGSILVIAPCLLILLFGALRRASTAL